jgi:hypothetical protein
MFIRTIYLSLLIIVSIQSIAQSDYWQQKVDYEIAIDFDTKNHSFNGKQTVTYYNNSPDTLYKLYFHLYYNAFHPNSLMDIWHQDVPDPQYNLDFKLKYLTSSETGMSRINQILQDKQQLLVIERETIAEVILTDPIPPRSVETFEMSFSARVPLLSRRTGRDNNEGVDYTMGQWYPKLCVYDRDGWHPTPFIGREFYSDFGDYEVFIRIDSSYTIAAGTDSFTVDTVANSNKKQWHFISQNALDFSWAADPDYTHYELTTEDGVTLNFYYLNKKEYRANWEKMGEPLRKIFPLITAKYGKYPYKSYSIIQAGDNATEYSKSTFITGDRNPGSLVGVSIHEIMHSWYQHQIATQENKYAWMDEGFASYASTQIKQLARSEGIFFGEPLNYLFEEQYKEYRLIHGARLEEPMSTPANHFRTNAAYYLASYSKGELFLEQLKYIVGDMAFEQGMKKYIADWSFKHPRPEDFIKSMELSSGLELDWYLHYWTNTTFTIDYRVQLDSINETKTLLSLQRIGRIPMPIDVEIQYNNDTTLLLNIPLDLMQGNKAMINEENSAVLNDWPWSHLVYQLELNIPFNTIRQVTIDPKLQMADINRENNVFIR